MAQINLLKQNTPSENSFGFIPKLVARILILVLVALIVYWVFLIMKSSTISKNIQKTKGEIEAARNQSMVVSGRAELLTRQQQLQALDGLLGSHFYWSQIIPKVASATLKKAQYTSMRVTSDGNLFLSVKVPDLESLDKYLQVFNIPEVNKNFSDVSINGYHKVLEKAGTSISFDVNMKFNPSIIQYNALSQAK